MVQRGADRPAELCGERGAPPALLLAALAVRRQRRRHPRRGFGGGCVERRLGRAAIGRQNGALVPRATGCAVAPVQADY